MFKVDWEKYLEKYLTSKDDSGKSGKQTWRTKNAMQSKTFQVD
jgi:hypothetical protein